MRSIIYLLSTKVDLCSALHKLVIFPSDSGRVHFEGFIQLLRYIRDNKNLGLKYYAKIEDEFLAELLRQASIKTENQLMASYDYFYTDCPDTCRITGVHIVFYQG